MFRFENYYTENKNFMGGVSQEHITAILRRKFPDFYLPTGAFNYEEINYILNTEVSNKKIFQAKLIELMRTLYSPRIKSINQKIFYNTSPELLKVSELYGQNIIAHGVEEEKGGMTTLLLIALTGYIYITKKSWGIFKPGAPDFSPLAHGPYYIIYKTNYSSHPLIPFSPKENAALNDMEYVLVPFREQVEILKAKAEQMYVDGILGLNKKEDFFKKVIDYETFAQIIFDKNILIS